MNFKFAILLLMLNLGAALQANRCTQGSWYDKYECLYNLSNRTPAEEARLQSLANSFMN